MKSWFRYRDLALNFLRREIENRYVGTGVGLYLALLHPLLQLGVYTLIFSIVFKAAFAELNGRSFVIFFAIGLWPWLMFREGIGRATQSIVSNAALVTKIAFPRALLVVAATTAPFLVHLVGFAVALALLAFFGETIRFAGIPNALLLLAAWYFCALALGMVFAAIQVFWRELDHLLDALWLLVFYATPILFTLSQVPERVRGVLSLNPLAYFFDRMRAVLLNDGPYFIATDFAFLVIAAALLWLAHRFFMRLEARFDDAL